jgi:hypothetical protein
MTTQRQDYPGLVEAVRQCVSQVAQLKGRAPVNFTIDGDDRTNPIVVAFRTAELLCADLVNGLNRIFEDRKVYGRTVRLKLESGGFGKELAVHQRLNQPEFRGQLEALLARFGSCPGDFWLDDGTNPDDVFVFIFSTPEILDSGVIEELARFSTKHPLNPFAVFYDVHSPTKDWLEPGQLQA